MAETWSAENDFCNLANNIFRKELYKTVFGLLYEGYSYTEIVGKFGGKYNYDYIKVIVSRVTKKFREQNPITILEFWSKEKSEEQSKLEYCQQFFGKYQKELTVLYTMEYHYCENNEDMTMGNIISNRRRIMGISLNELAEKTSINYNSLTSYEGDFMKPHVATVKKLEVALELPSGTLTSFLLQERDFDINTRGGQIKYQRILKGYTQSDLAKAMETTSGYINNLEMNRTTSNKMYTKLEKFLGIG